MMKAIHPNVQEGFPLLLAKRLAYIFVGIL